MPFERLRTPAELWRGHARERTTSVKSRRGTIIPRIDDSADRIAKFAQTLHAGAGRLVT